jgi:hypothetical protein
MRRKRLDREAQAMRREFRRELRRDDANAVRHSVSSHAGIILGASQIVRCELERC